jgi:ferredoxin
MPEFNADKCIGCSACVSQCSSGALTYIGRGG